jgi:hypothetical protein
MNSSSFGHHDLALPYYRLRHYLTKSFATGPGSADERVECFQYDGYERCYLLPATTYQDLSGAPIPLVVEMHGIGGCAEL